jgi:hypothetical protein
MDSERLSTETIKTQYRKDSERRRPECYVLLQLCVESDARRTCVIYFLIKKLINYCKYMGLFLKL